MTVVRHRQVCRRFTLIFTPFVRAPCFVNSKRCGLDVVRPAYVGKQSYDRLWIDRLKTIVNTNNNTSAKSIADTNTNTSVEKYCQCQYQYIVTILLIIYYILQRSLNLWSSMNEVNRKIVVEKLQNHYSLQYMMLMRKHCSNFSWDARLQS